MSDGAEAAGANDVAAAEAAAAEGKITAAKSDLLAAKAEVAAAKSDFLAAKSDVAAAKSDFLAAEVRYRSEQDEAMQASLLNTYKALSKTHSILLDNMESNQKVLSAAVNSLTALLTSSDGPETKRMRYEPARFVKGVDPEASLTIAREPLVLRILQLVSQQELVLLKGPAAVGKTSLMNLTGHYCRTNDTTDNFVPTTGYTFMEKEEASKPALEQLNDAVAKLPPLPEFHEYRVLFCDDIQNVASSFWERLVNLDFLKQNKLRIVGATTRRCASDPASPILGNGALMSFSDLSLSSDEVIEFLSKFIPTKRNVSTLAEDDQKMVVRAILDQCSGHIYAIMVSLDKLDEFAEVPANNDAKSMISHLLSKDFLKHTYTRIWPENVDDFSLVRRVELQDAMLHDTDVSTDLQSLLMKVYFIQDSNQATKPRPWSTIKQEVSFKLSARRLYSSLFSTRALQSTTVESIEDLVFLSLSNFKRVDLLQSAKASDGKFSFPKEGPLQQMFFVGLTSSLPASTEVVTEMSAIMPRRGKKRGELDFYVNSHYYYGIELMRKGNNFKEHKERFLGPIAGQPDSSGRGKYFTPKIADFRVVDFEAAGFVAKDEDESRLLVVFSKGYTGCTLTSWSSGKATIKQINFS